MFYIDPTYLFCVLIPSLIITISAQIYMSSTYRKWRKVRNSSELAGFQVGQYLVRESTLGLTDLSLEQIPEYKKLKQLHEQGVVNDEEFELKSDEIAKRASSFSAAGIRFAPTPGQLSDHYDPRSQTVYLSEATAREDSVASMAIVAHELGHAEQHLERSFLITIRNIFVPAIRFSPTLAYILIFAGLIFNFTGLIYLGILFYGLVVVFSLITLPVEFDASRRGLTLLEDAGLLRTTDDKRGSASVLRGAGLTYVAAAFTAILQLFFYLGLARRRS
jgi:Zn-dependent membrane protease YugP